MKTFSSIALTAIALCGHGGCDASLLHQAAATADAKYEYLVNLAAEQTSSEPEVLNLVRQAFTQNNPEALYELAYSTNGFSGAMARDKQLSQLILSSLIKQGDPVAIQLNDFMTSRSPAKAQQLLKLAQTPRQRALAFMCLAEAYFAKNDVAKTMLYTVLSLATHPSELYDRQAQFYTSKVFGQEISLLQSRDQLLAELRTLMESSGNSAKFKAAFEMATALDLLPSYPLNLSEQPIDSEAYEIFYSVDDGYVKHAAVSVMSAMLSADPGRRYDFKFIDDRTRPISSKNRAKLEELVHLLGDDRFTMEFIPVNKNMLPRVIQRFNASYWPWNVFYKLILPKLSQDSERSLWLDADTIVTKDLHPLYEQDFEGRWFLGTRDVEASKRLKGIAMPYDSNYLNVGVLLVNNKAIDQAGGMQTMDDVDELRPDFVYLLDFPEQDLLALLYQDHIKEIDVQTRMENHEKDFRGQWNWFAHEHNSTHWRNVHGHWAGIIHMEGNHIKPWKKIIRWQRWHHDPKKNNGVMNLYWSLRDMGPWPAR